VQGETKVGENKGMQAITKFFRDMARTFRRRDDDFGDLLLDHLGLPR